MSSAILPLLLLLFATLEGSERNGVFRDFRKIDWLLGRCDEVNLSGKLCYKEEEEVVVVWIKQIHEWKRT